MRPRRLLPILMLVAALLGASLPATGQAAPPRAAAAKSAKAKAKRACASRQTKKAKRACLAARKRAAKRAAARRRAAKRWAAAKRQAAAKRKAADQRKAANTSVTAPPAGPSWVGGYEAPSFGEWDQLNGNLAQRDRYFKTLSRPAPVFDGQHSFESVVDDGAVEAGQSGQRSMVLLFPSHATTANQNRSGGFEGNEQWYRTHVYFPETFMPSPNNGWNWIVQWHNWPDGICCHNLSLAVDTKGGGERLSLRVMGGGDAAHPVESDPVIYERNPTGHLEWFVGDPALHRNHWYDVLVHVKWSYEPSKGFVEWWLDGRKIMSRQLATLYWYADNDKRVPGETPGPGQTYYMEGYYRPSILPDGSVDRSVASVIYDGARIGPTADSVR